MKVEFEYTRCGACERLIAQVMAQPPYRDARRVFWILDNGTSHRGAPYVARLQKHLRPVFGARKLAGVTGDQVENYLRWRRDPVGDLGIRKPSGRRSRS